MLIKQILNLIVVDLSGESRAQPSTVQRIESAANSHSHNTSDKRMNKRAYTNWTDSRTHGVCQTSKWPFFADSLSAQVQNAQCGLHAVSGERASSILGVSGGLLSIDYSRARARLIGCF